RSRLQSVGSGVHGPALQHRRRMDHRDDHNPVGGGGLLCHDESDQNRGLIPMKNLTKNTLFSLAALALSVSAAANVSLKNGNFFVGYTDIVYPGGFEPKIERVYNSKTGFKGMFGFGWGNEYEVYVTVSADGSVVVHEYGGGAENRFNPTAFN